MEFISNNILIIMFFPIWVSLVLLLNSMTGFGSSKRLTTVLTLISTLVGFCFSLALVYVVIKGNVPSFEDSVLWFSAGPLNFYFGFLLDKISALFLVVLMSISLVVQIYSHGYMNKDINFSRYYIYLNLFNFSMTGLVLSSNLLQTYVFWELVGVCSYLLIGFWIKKKSASKAAQKAFMVNRIGDCCLLAGIVALIYFSVNYLNITGPDFLAFSNMQYFSEELYPLLTPVLFYLLCLGLLLGAVAKSAQFPLHVWLADAMEAPTPVSALIHAATMVAAGIFLVVRLYPMFTLSAEVMNTILCIGLITALLGAYFALTQNDIKRMLAHSTSSQLGLMFVALGVLAPSAALFHFLIHAYYKALLFLSAGIVIIYLQHNQDMRKMGNLRSKLPLCAAVYLIGAFCLSGTFFSGYFSKEALLDAIYHQSNVVVLALFLLVSFMSAFYIFKSYFLVFEGKRRNNIFPQKVPKSMSLAVILLAVPSAFLGFALNKGFSNFMNPFGMRVYEAPDIKLVMTALVVAVFAILLAAFVVFKQKYNKFLPTFAYKYSYNKGYFDEIYSLFVKKVFMNLCKTIDFIDKWIIDGLVKFVGLFVRMSSWVVNKLQNGSMQAYLSYSIFLIGVVFATVVGFYFWLLRG